MITNNTIRTFLCIPSNKDIKFRINSVSGLGSYNYNTMMFMIEGIDIDLKKYDYYNNECVFLVDHTYPEIKSSKNDFIRVINPKLQFCKVVNHLKIPSELQLNFYRDYGRLRDTSGISRCTEVMIGENCHIDPTAIIGEADFSPVLGDSSDYGTLYQFPQLGGVSIGDSVVIKPYTMVGRGTFDFTKIGNNTMIDYGCQIGHNCNIGNRCIIAAGTIIGGSTTIGDNTVIGIGAKIRNGLKIGSNVSIGMGSVVIRDIPDNTVVVGNPARVIEHKKIFDEKGLV